MCATPSQQCAQSRARRRRREVGGDNARKVRRTANCCQRGLKELKSSGEWKRWLAYKFRDFASTGTRPKLPGLSRPFRDGWQLCSCGRAITSYGRDIDEGHFTVHFVDSVYWLPPVMAEIFCLTPQFFCLTLDPQNISSHDA